MLLDPVLLFLEFLMIGQYDSITLNASDDFLRRIATKIFELSKLACLYMAF